MKIGPAGALESIGVGTWLQRPLARLYEWLGTANCPGDSDLIFALAGRENRKKYALEMFSQGLAPDLLLSVGRFEIRRFGNLPLPDRSNVNLVEAAAAVKPRQRHFFVHFGNAADTVRTNRAGTSLVELIPQGRFGTLSEIRALRAWLGRRSAIQSISIVSSAVHLRRVGLCCRRLLPARVQFRLLPANEESELLRPDSWWRSRDTRNIVLAELGKLALYWVVLGVQSMGRGRTFQEEAA